MAPRPYRGRPLILCIEDSQPQLEMLKNILEGNGFIVLQASTAEEALRICRAAPVSLVLSDHMLSGSTGSELAGQIKVLQPTVPVVLHSGTLPTSMRHVDCFLHKGEPIPTLVAFIRDLISRFAE